MRSFGRLFWRFFGTRLGKAFSLHLSTALASLSMLGCNVPTEAMSGSEVKPPAKIISVNAAETNFETTAHYLANEGVFIERGDTKIMFDPFFVTGFGTYTEMPIDLKAAIMKGTQPFDGVDAVFVSHAHGDHFSAPDMIAYMTFHSGVRLIAPQQAVDMMQEDPKWTVKLVARITPLALKYGDAPLELNVGDIKASAIRIAHAGWPAPKRAQVENLLFRVQIADDVTVMHMGDADPNPVHYQAYKTHWKALQTDTAFPPYWMLTSPTGREILDGMNIKERVGIHVPITIPPEMRASGEDYFSNVGEMRQVGQ